MNEPHGAQRQRERNACSHQCALPRCNGEVLCGMQIHTGIAAVRALGHGQVGVDPLQRNRPDAVCASFNRLISHGPTLRQVGGVLSRTDSALAGCGSDANAILAHSRARQEQD